MKTSCTHDLIMDLSHRPRYYSKHFLAANKWPPTVIASVRLMKRHRGPWIVCSWVLEIPVIASSYSLTWNRRQTVRTNAATSPTSFAVVALIFVATHATLFTWRICILLRIDAPFSDLTRHRFIGQP